MGSTLKLACPHCGEYRSIVKDSRPLPDGIARRRECETCHRRYTTLEQVSTVTFTPLKENSTHYNI